ncbi:MAG TPA: phosphonate ABC transporter ATP-binding protein [Caulobacteraceae bacterium]
MSSEPLSEPLLKVRTVSKNFAGASALEGISLDIRQGEMIALLGPSGAGKSTLLRSLNGLARIDAGSGRIEAFGRTLQPGRNGGREVRRMRAGIGFIFQQFNLVGRLSLFANVALGCLGRVGFWRGLLGLWPATVKRDTMAALVRVGLGERAGQRASTLSGGEQQRGAVARALVQKAKILLADEPVASLDPVAASRVLELLRSLTTEDSLAVLISLHQVDYARRFCERAVALKAGRIVYDGPTRDLSAERLAKIYGPPFVGAGA